MRGLKELLNVVIDHASNGKHAIISPEEKEQLLVLEKILENSFLANAINEVMWVARDEGQLNYDEEIELEKLVSLLMPLPKQ